MTQAGLAGYAWFMTWDTAAAAPKAQPRPSVPATYGLSRWSAVVCGELRVMHCSLAPGVLPPHVHDHTVVAVMLHGDLRYDFGTRLFDCTPSSIISVPGGESHHNAAGSEGAHGLVIEIATKLLNSEPWLGASWIRTPHHLRDPDGRALALRAVNELRHRDNVSPLALEALSLELIARGARLATESLRGGIPAWLRRARDLVEDRFAEHLGLAEIAREVGVHRTHLARQFRARYGDTIGGLQRAARIRWAADALARTDLPLVEIAAQAGFADQAHFTRTFGRLMQCTPHAYRRAQRG